MIELYIENKKIDLAEDLEISFTYESIDPDKLSSIKNSFSKTVSIPGTPSNNIIFGHIFRSDKYIPANTLENIESGYDPHKKVNWFINKNGVLINRGYCTLDNILIQNERKITYQITLYGGIGEFFYSLSYNDDGSPKTLYDVFFNWYPKTSLVGHGAAMSLGSEQTSTLMKCSADIVSQAYHSLSPEYRYTGTTDFEKDVVPIPAYCGIPEDFDATKMLVSTFNQNYNPGTPVISADTRSLLQNSFPDSITDSDGSAYYTVGSTFSQSDSYRYGVATFSRELEPSEAGDLRVNELPFAMRMSKMLYAISQPENNGGYTVDWDTNVLDSYYWKYGWLVLGKIKQDREKYSVAALAPVEGYDGFQNTVDITTANVIDSSYCPQYTLYSGQLSEGNYQFSEWITPKAMLKTAAGVKHYVPAQPGRPSHYEWDYYGWDYYYTQARELFSGSYWSETGKGFERWNVQVVINRIYNGTSLISEFADVFYYKNQSSSFGTPKRNPFNKPNVYNGVKNSLISRINSEFGMNITDFNVHNCTLEMSNKQGYANNNYEIEFECDQVNIKRNFYTGNTNIEIKQDQKMFFVQWEYSSSASNFTSGVYGEDNPNSLLTLGFNSSVLKAKLTLFSLTNGSQSVFKKPSANSTTTYVEADQSYWFADFMSENSPNGIFLAKSTGFNILNVNKKLLFANSSSPMKYLVDFCKLLNLKFICDNTKKTVYIRRIKSYYKNNVIDIKDKVDLRRDINVKPILTDAKNIVVGLETVDTYPVYIFNKTSKEKFNKAKYDTKLEYAVKDTELLNNLVYKNAIDWQLSGTYFNIYPQIPRPYAVQSISWTLFDTANSQADEIKSKEFFTPGAPTLDSALSATTDFLPKLSMFDNSNKNVDLKDSLIFLNGFVKNYDYSDTGVSTVTVSPSSIVENSYVKNNGGISASNIQNINVYNITYSDIQNNVYKVTFNFTASSSTYAIYYFDSNDNLTGREYVKGNSTITDGTLTIPSGTTTIKFTYLKADTTAKITATGNHFAVSPKVIFTNDTVEQYYLTGGRCYMSDFKYNDNFVPWGCYSSDQKGSATSWVLPFFSRDLYNICDSSNNWSAMPYKVASWNIVNQEGLDGIYDLMNTAFVKSPDYTFSKIVSDTTGVAANEYSVNGITQDEPGQTRIYDTIWKGYLDELYGRNVREVTAYVNLSEFSDPNDIMRNIYSWQGHKWVITKMFNYKTSNIMNDRFTKVTLHKIVNINNWV